MYMGIDQYGTTYHDLKHPRKDLMERLGYKSAHKMYIGEDTPKHIGYVIGRHWVTIYQVKPWEKP